MYHVSIWLHKGIPKTKENLNKSCLLNDIVFPYLQGQDIKLNSTIKYSDIEKLHIVETELDYENLEKLANKNDVDGQFTLYTFNDLTDNSYCKDATSDIINEAKNLLMNS